MNRREAASLMAMLVLAGCGGGGGGGGSVTGDAPSSGSSGSSGSSQPTAFSASSGIAAWGDSHTAGLPGNPLVPGFAAKLLELVSGRDVFVGGTAGLTSRQIADLQVQDDAHDSWVNIFWYGGNNESEPEQIKADLARSIASLAPGNDRYLVLPVLNQASPWERRGSAGYDTIVRLNAELAALYPGHYLDIRSYLVNHYDASSPQDVADFQDDVPPTSLRADGVHLNVRGYLLVAEQVLQFLASHGW